jgi:hypothetical protein
MPAESSRLREREEDGRVSTFIPRARQGRLWLQWCADPRPTSPASGRATSQVRDKRHHRPSADAAGRDREGGSGPGRPVVARYRDRTKRRFFRGDAAFRLDRNPATLASMSGERAIHLGNVGLSLISRSVVRDANSLHCSTLLIPRPVRSTAQGQPEVQTWPTSSLPPRGFGSWCQYLPASGSRS